MSGAKRGAQRRRDHAQSDETIASVTGVASGGLGTAANLDDTKVLSTIGVDEPETLEPELSLEPVEPSHDAPASPVGGHRFSRPEVRIGRGLVGVLTGAVATLATVAILTLGGNGASGTGYPLPTIVAGATFGPVATEPAASEDSAAGKKCKGKGNSNCGGRGGN